jgi:hypothetical protein
MEHSFSRRFRALGVDLPTALSGPWIVLSATLSGYPVIFIMEALQGLNPPA